MYHMILASGSPRRRELLENIGLQFDILPSDVEETIEEGLPPYLVVEQLSLLKAADVAKSQDKHALIIGADTIVVLDGAILTKPKDEADAFAMLEKLSGKCHSVLTGLSIVRNFDGKCVSVCEETKVYFKKLSAEEINAYIKTGEPSDKAGAYGIQGYGSMLIEKIEGDYFNVVGLPIARLYQLLYTEYDINILLEGK